MPFHLAGFLESLDPAGAFVGMAALQDDRVTTQGDNLRVPPQLNRIVALAGGAENTAAPRIRLTSPTLERFTRYEIAPLNVGAAAAVEPNSPHRIVKLLNAPLLLGADENLRVDIDSNPAAAQVQWALLWFANGPIAPVPTGDMFTVRLTGTTTLVANAWTPCVLTLDDELPPGRYQIVGMRAQSTGCVAARIVLREGDQWRPGCLGTDAEDDLDDTVFRYGNFGVWGEFPFTQLPAVEFLAISADTAEIVHFDLIRVGNG